MAKTKSSPAAPKLVTVFDRQWARSPASCSCCSASPTRDDAPLTEYPWYCYRAGLTDRDGVHYGYLCGDVDGLAGCLESVLLEQHKDKVAGRKPTGAQVATKILSDLMPDDPDGVQAEIEDGVAMGLFDSLAEDVE